MASVEKQTIFLMPTKEVDEITILTDGDWHRPVVRTWGKGQEVTRHLFKIKGEKYKWFECGERMADHILKLIDKYGRSMKEVRFVLDPIRIDIKPQTEFLSMWQRFKKLIGGRK